MVLRYQDMFQSQLYLASAHDHACNRRVLECRRLVLMRMIDKFRYRSESLLSLEAPAASDRKELIAEDYKDGTDFDTSGRKYRIYFLAETAGKLNKTCYY